jgi:hypothetical protein
MWIIAGSSPRPSSLPSSTTPGGVPAGTLVFGIAVVPSLVDCEPCPEVDTPPVPPPEFVALRLLVDPDPLTDFGSAPPPVAAGGLFSMSMY